MTDRPAVGEIQRWNGREPFYEYGPGGQFVTFADHQIAMATALAACASQSKRVAVEAKIEVLEEEDAHMVAFLGGTYTDENREWRQAKIAALRKELGS